jgi:hypothetical protein
MLTRMLVPKPKNAFQSPGDQSVGLWVFMDVTPDLFEPPAHGADAAPAHRRSPAAPYHLTRANRKQRRLACIKRARERTHPAGPG